MNPSRRSRISVGGFRTLYDTYRTAVKYLVYNLSAKIQEPRKIVKSSKRRSPASSPSYESRPPRPVKPHLVNTRPCKHHMKGQCKYGQKCFFAHGREDLSPGAYGTHSSVSLNQIKELQGDNMNPLKMMSSVPAWKKPNGRYLSIGGASTAASSSARPSVDIDPAIVAALQSAPPTQNLAGGHPPVYHGQQSEAPREPAENSPMVPPTVASMASRHDLSPRNNDASETSSRIVETLVGLMEDFKPLEEMSRDELYSFAAAVLLQDPPQRHGNSVRDDQYT